MASWKRILAVADRRQRRFLQMVHRAAELGRRAIDVEALDLAIRDGERGRVEYEATRAVAKVEKHIRDTMPGEIVATMNAAGKVAADEVNELGSFYAAEEGNGLEDGVRAALRAACGSYQSHRAADIGVSFDIYNKRAVQWAREHAAEHVKQINAQTRAALRAIIARGFEEGIPPRGLAKLIRETVGLTKHQSDLVLKFRSKLANAKRGNIISVGGYRFRVPKAGFTALDLEKKAARYSRKLLNQRALTIARTESVAAANEGQRQLWLQARDERRLPVNQLRTWIVTPDDRLCVTCAQIDGEQRGLEELFSIGVMGPPAHPDCRCTTGLIRTENPIFKSPLLPPSTTPAPQQTPQAEGAQEASI